MKIANLCLELYNFSQLHKNTCETKNNQFQYLLSHQVRSRIHPSINLAMEIPVF